MEFDKDPEGTGNVTEQQDRMSSGRARGNRMSSSSEGQIPSTSANLFNMSFHQTNVKSPTNKKTVHLNIPKIKLSVRETSKLQAPTDADELSSKVDQNVTTTKGTPTQDKFQFPERLEAKGFSINEIKIRSLLQAIDEGLKYNRLLTPGANFTMTMIMGHITHHFKSVGISMQETNSALNAVERQDARGKYLTLLVAALEYNVNIVVVSPTRTTQFPETRLESVHTIFLALCDNYFKLIIPNKVGNGIQEQNINKESQNKPINDDLKTKKVGPREKAKKRNSYTEHEGSVQKSGLVHFTSSESCSFTSSKLDVCSTPTRDSASLTENKKMPDKITCTSNASTSDRQLSDEENTAADMIDCPYCEYKCKNKDDLFLHKYQQHTTGPMCIVCDRMFASLPARYAHMRKEHGAKPYKCDKCQKPFISPHYLLAHRAVHFALKNFVCKICGQKFKYSPSLSRHKAGVHNVEISHIKPPEKNNSTDICNQSKNESDEEDPKYVMIPDFSDIDKEKKKKKSDDNKDDKDWVPDKFIKGGRKRFKMNLRSKTLHQRPSSEDPKDDGANPNSEP